MFRQYLDLAALGTSCLAFYFVTRMKATYFLDSRVFIGIANGAFIIILLQDYISDATISPFPQPLFVSMIFLTALSIGFASFMLSNTGTEESGLGRMRGFLARPPFSFLIFSIVGVIWLVVGIALSPWKVYMADTLDGMAYFYIYENWFLTASLAFLLTFIAGPVAAAYLRARQIVDQKASESIRIISLSWASFGVVALFQAVAAGTIGLIGESIATLANSLLFLLIAFAIREPTVLSRIISADKVVGRERVSSAINDADKVGTGVSEFDGEPEGFSSLLHMKHDELEHKRILVEYDPTAKYERIVKKFALEYLANTQPVAVFTSVGSPVHRLLHGLHDVKLFSFSTKTSTPSRQSETEILLPERDASLLLDAVDKLFQSHHGREIALAFDVFTDLILFKGFEKAYGVLSSVSEMVDSQVATSLVLINEAALDTRALSGVRSLFASHLAFDGDGLRVIRIGTGVLLRPSVGQNESLGEESRGDEVKG